MKKGNFILSMLLGRENVFCRKGLHALKQTWTSLMSSLRPYLAWVLCPVHVLFCMELKKKVYLANVLWWAFSKLRKARLDRVKDISAPLFCWIGYGSTLFYCIPKSQLFDFCWYYCLMRGKSNSVTQISSLCWGIPLNHWSHYAKCSSCSISDRRSLSNQALFSWDMRISCHSRLARHKRQFSLYKNEMKVWRCNDQLKMWSRM